MAVPSPSTAATEVVGLDQTLFLFSPWALFKTKNYFELTQTEMTSLRKSFLFLVDW